MTELYDHGCLLPSECKRNDDSECFEYVFSHWHESNTMSQRRTHIEHIHLPVFSAITHASTAISNYEFIAFDSV